MFSRLFGHGRNASAAPQAPPGVRLYAIGDIHGRVDLLQRLHQQIVADGADGPERKLVVYLGDYVDRGDHSRQVIEMLIEPPPDGFERVLLMGNHEEMMGTFLEDASIGPAWFANGGDATLFSYGVGAPDGVVGEARIIAMQQAIREKLPDTHRQFLRALQLYHVEGDYLFVHAGMRPGRAIEDQDHRDLLWIRDAFLSSQARHAHCVVHGHTIVEEPEFHDNRIAIDTGAFFSNVLTCLVLEGDARRLLQT